VPYPLPKTDIVAIPDFAAGAMKNYGLVTYHETTLLFDEMHSAAANKQWVGHYAIVLFQLLYLYTKLITCNYVSSHDM
jgi:hypothetical protein